MKAQRSLLYSSLSSVGVKSSDSKIAAQKSTYSMLLFEFCKQVDIISPYEKRLNLDFQGQSTM